MTIITRSIYEAKKVEIEKQVLACRKLDTAPTITIDSVLC